MGGPLESPNRVSWKQDSADRGPAVYRRGDDAADGAVVQPELVADVVGLLAVGVALQNRPDNFWWLFGPLRGHDRVHRAVVVLIATTDCICAASGQFALRRNHGDDTG